MANERHSLATYVSDMLALERHIRVPFETQANDGEFAGYPEAKRIVDRLVATADAHITFLDDALTQLGGHEASPIKSAVVGVEGFFAGAIDKMRKTKVSKALRDDYTADCAKRVERWNKIIEKAGIAFRLALPHVGFNRRIGEFAKATLDPEGRPMAAEEWARRQGEFLPSTDDGAFLASLMQPVRDRGAYAGWIAPAKAGIDNKPGDFEYVRIHD